MEQSYLRNRYYSPSIGRFITEDPVQDEMNWYVYAGNNPIRYIDPNGLHQIPQIVGGKVIGVHWDLRYLLDIFNGVFKIGTETRNKGNIELKDLGGYANVIVSMDFLTISH